MRKVAVVGVGETKFSGPQEKTEVELFAEAAMDALNESSLKPKDIQALFMGNVLGDISEGQGMVQSFAAENIGCFNVPANRYEGACASGSMAIRDAFIWIASGFYDIVLAGGTERAATMGTPSPLEPLLCSVMLAMSILQELPSPESLPYWLTSMLTSTVYPWRSSRSRWQRYRFNPIVTVCSTPRHTCRRT